MSKIIYSDSFIEFLKNSNHNIAKLLYKIHCKGKSSNIVNTNEINYITFRKDGTISYLPNGKDCLFTEDGTWKKDGRQNGKPSKTIRKLFTKRVLKYIKDSDFENFTNEYKSKFNDDEYRIEILENSRIGEVYNDFLRKEGEGTLNDSCMNGDDYQEIYEKCKDVQIVVILNKNDQLCGRCLLWTIEDIKLMDRFYVSDDFLYDTLIEFCEDNKFWRKKDFKSYSNKTCFIDPNGDEVYKNLTIYTNTDCDYYPYIDTFTYGEDGELNNYSGTYEYTNTDGTREGDHDGEVYDDINEEWINEDDAIYIEDGERRYKNRYTHIDNVVFVNDCAYHTNDENIVCVDGNYYTTDSDEIIDIDGTYYKRDSDDICYSDYDSEYYLIDDCIYSDHHNSYILTSDAIKVVDSIYHKDDITEL